KDHRDSIRVRGWRYASRARRGSESSGRTLILRVCEACLSSDIRVRAKRRRTGAKILQCRSCGLRMLDLTYSLDETSAGYDVPADHIAEWNSMKRDSVEEQAWPASLAELA